MKYRCKELEESSQPILHQLIMALGMSSEIKYSPTILASPHWLMRNVSDETSHVFRYMMLPVAAGWAFL